MKPEDYPAADGDRMRVAEAPKNIVELRLAAKQYVATEDEDERERLSWTIGNSGCGLTGKLADRVLLPDDRLVVGWKPSRGRRHWLVSVNRI